MVGSLFQPPFGPEVSWEVCWEEFQGSFWPFGFETPNAFVCGTRCALVKKKFRKKIIKN